MSVNRSALPLCVDVLGPLQLRVEGREVAVPGALRRGLLAVLALAGGRGVGVDRLVDGLWPEGPPDNAVPALYSHVSRLRGHLGARSDRLERYAGGYRLRLEPHELDVDAARRLAAEVAAADDRPAAAQELARAALALWRGTALEEFRALPALEAEAVGLDELRLRLVDDLLDARLRSGDRTVAVDAATAAAAAPLRERTALLHVRALAADGRAGEAMAAAHAFRRRLTDETGLDPGPELGRLEQQVAAGGVEPFTPPASVPRRAVLARPDGPMVGRQHDREEVLRLLGSHATVTLTGPGGVGKSRLALDVAADPTAVEGDTDVVLVDLAAVTQPERVGAAVATSLGLRTAGPVTVHELAAAVADRELLLVLDNCEHVLEACRDLLVDVQRRAPGVRVLATSRSTLHVPGEYVVRLQPLPVPRDVTDLEGLRRQPAARAFLEHAHRRAPGFDLTESDAEHLLDVLRRLDGLPLGIELAARQVAVMPLAEVRARLDRALDLALGPRGVDADRQRTLRATIGSSYRMLDEECRRLLRAIAVFPGGVDLRTVESLAAALGTRTDPVDVLHGLVDSSLVVADAHGGRYRLLFTVRSFLRDAAEAAGETAADETRFLDRSVVVAQEIGAEMTGPEEAAVNRRLRDELDNLRAARDLALAHRRDDVRVDITVALGEVTLWRDLREPWTWALELAEDPRLAGHPQQAVVLGCAAEAARLTGDLDRALDLAERSLELAGDDLGLASRALSARATVAHYRGDFAAARDGWVKSGEGRPHGSTAYYLASAALAATYGGDPDDARRLLDQAQAANARRGCVSLSAFTDYVEGELLAGSHLEGAMVHYRRAVEEARGIGATFVEGVAGVSLASAMTRTGDIGGAAESFGYLIELWRRTGQDTQLWTTARNAASLLGDAGRTRVAALLLISADVAPAAAAVDPDIAARSTRIYTALSSLVDDEALEQLRTDALRLGPSAVLDLGVAELRELASEQGPGSEHARGRRVGSTS